MSFIVHVVLKIHIKYSNNCSFCLYLHEEGNQDDIVRKEWVDELSNTVHLQTRIRFHLLVQKLIVFLSLNAS